jgi:predicted PurR-regulated permease PerM
MALQRPELTGYKKPPIVRLPPRSTKEVALARGAQVAVIATGAIAVIAALSAGSFILIPVTLGIVVGLMLGPVASALERRGVAPGISASVVVLIFILIVILLSLAVLAPLSQWVERLPAIWAELRSQIVELRGPLEALRGVRDQLRELTGGEGITVSVDEGLGLTGFAVAAPALAGQVVIFFASLYFFVATRHQTRVATLRLCFNRRLRWRVAHVFRDVERLISRYLLSITAINIGEGVAVWLALWAAGVPSAALWGVMAAILNYVVFVGPTLMTVILLVVGLVEYDTLAMGLLPVAIYLTINLAEANFVTPMVIGRTMTLNPFLIVLALVFWIWLWGPVGGFIAVPALLACYAVASNIIPGMGASDGPRK